MSRFLLLLPACVFVCVCYLIGVCMSERCVVLAGAVGGPVFIHGWGGRGFIEQAALCGWGRERMETLGKFQETRWVELRPRCAFTFCVPSAHARVPQLRFGRRGRLGVT